MASASDYVSKEVLEQVSTESFAQNISNYRGLLIRWGKEVDADSLDDKRAQLLFKEASMLQEIIQGQISAAGSNARSLGVPPEALQEVLEIYTKVLQKLVLRVARGLDLYSPELQRIIDTVEGLAPEMQAPQLKNFVSKVKTARVALGQLISNPMAASLIAPIFLTLMNELAAMARDIAPHRFDGAPPQPPSPPPPDGRGEGGGGQDIPRRVQKLEDKMDSVAGDIAAIKNTLVRLEEFLKHAAMKSDVAKVEERLAHTPTKAEMYIAGGAAAAAVIGLMAKGFGWL
ncbi:hypothetical protein [Delftia sp. PS-11]|uniref:hypothetical protein n=1 Tax=Delftia sp. PS-11 TaxID=2767222 RepID=UPI002456E689|nr:hypothetical protein [Delftia sp. PS-11]KAJ8743701.1 hypothetical protein H9T68_16015 [Delftia sp. PS-11]